jgi:hypothetical protein
MQWNAASDDWHTTAATVDLREGGAFSSRMEAKDGSMEHVTVMSGSLNLGIGDKLETGKTTALTAGSIAIMQPKTAHFVWTKEETIAQVHGVGPWGVNYVNPDDDPRKKD